MRNLITILVLMIATSAAAQERTIEDRVREILANLQELVGALAVEPPPPPTCELTMSDCPLGLNLAECECYPEPPPPPPPPIPTPVAGEWTRMGTPPGGTLDAFDGWVDEQCGAPRSEWPVYEVGPGKPIEVLSLVRNTFRGGIGVVRVFWKPEQYDVLKLGDQTCVEVVGVPGPNGELPSVAGGINMTHGYPEGSPIKPGGLIVRGMRFNDILGVPSSQQFIAMEDSVMDTCGSHCMITSHNARHLYVRLLRNTFQNGASNHLLYIDRVARADVIGNRLQSPGTGHAVRVIAHSARVEDNIASNVKFDGTIQEPRLSGRHTGEPGSGKAGLHPFDLYGCSDMIVRGNTAIYYNTNNVGGAYKVRYRGDFGGCETLGKSEDGQSWIGMVPTSAEYQDPQTWRTIGASLDQEGPESPFAFHMVFENNVAKLYGPSGDKRTMQISSGWPFHGSDTDTEIKAEMLALITEHPELMPGATGGTWRETCDALSAIATNEPLAFVFRHALDPDGKLKQVCGQKYSASKVPYPAPCAVETDGILEGGWREREYLTFGLGNETQDCASGSCVAGLNILNPDSTGALVGNCARNDDGDPFVNIINIGGATIYCDDGPCRPDDPPPPPPPPPPPDPVPDPDPPPPDPDPDPNPIDLAMSWSHLVNSSQDSIFIEEVDRTPFPAGWKGSWNGIQDAWGGGTCVGDELFIFGGGHGDGLHNGVLAMNAKTGVWRRVTEPSDPTTWWEYTPAACPGGLCPAPHGECAIDDPTQKATGVDQCSEFPDGRPVPVHTYTMLNSDASNLYISGGSFGQGYKGQTWRFDLVSEEWEMLAVNPAAKGHGGSEVHDGKYYYHSSGGHRVLDLATNVWSTLNKGPGRGGTVVTVLAQSTGRVYFLGSDEAYSVTFEQWGLEGAPIANHPPVISETTIGATYHPPSGLILMWKGGQSITTLDPATNAWGTFVAGGEAPGPVNTSGGPFRRFSYCGGHVVLVNGHDRDAMILETP